MRLNITGIAVTLLLAVFSAGNVHAAPLPEVVTKLVAEAKTKVTTIDMENFRKVVDIRAYDYIIDVREPDEYASGHVPGAINIPRGVIEFRIWALVGYPDSTNTGMTSGRPSTHMITAWLPAPTSEIAPVPSM